MSCLCDLSALCGAKIILCRVGISIEVRLFTGNSWVRVPQSEP